MTIERAVQSYTQPTQRIWVGFSRDNSFLSWLIRKVTKGPASHCFLILSADLTPLRCEMILEASAFGVRLIPLERFKRRNTVVGTWTSADSKYDLLAALATMSADLGDVYDYGGLFGMAWVVIGRWLRKKWQNPLHAAHTLFCSELVDTFLRAALVQGADGLPASSWEPNDLWRLLQPTRLL